MENIFNLLDVLGIVKSPNTTHNHWLMTPLERATVLGILEVLRPERTLEIGCRFGGCTEYLSKYSGKVLSIDIDPNVTDVCKNFKNVTAVCSFSTVSMDALFKNKEYFDLIIIDGDHSREGAREDLLRAMKIGKILLLHDTFNPECRSGYLEALADKKIAYDLDFIKGGTQEDGDWAGLGIVLPCIDNPNLKFKINY